jgi:hypothetical protein
MSHGSPSRWPPQYGEHESIATSSSLANARSTVSPALITDYHSGTGTEDSMSVAAADAAAYSPIDG